MKAISGDHCWHTDKNAWCQAVTVYPNKYAHGFVVRCFVVVMQSFIMNSHEVFIHIHQGCFAGTGAIVRLPQCQRSKPGGYGKISQCITTTKHSKAKTVCIFLGLYCMLWHSEPDPVNCTSQLCRWRRHDIGTLSILPVITGPLWGNPPVTGGFPSQRANNAKLWYFSILAWTSFWTNLRVASDLIYHGAPVTLLKCILCSLNFPLFPFVWHLVDLFRTYSMKSQNCRPTFSGWIKWAHMMTSSNGNIFRAIAFCAGNSPVTGEFPAQRPVTRSFGVFFDLRIE